LESLRVDNAEESAAMIREVLSGTAGRPRDIVVLNAAAALWVADRASSPRECAQMAATAIDSGAADELLERLVELSNR
jgi:anthranilate phosphoribosyltransferase